MNEKWVIDATITRDEDAEKGFFAFCPIEFAENYAMTGDFEVIVGLTVLAADPPGELVGVVHQDGQKAVEAWSIKFADQIAKFKNDEDNSSQS